MIRWRARAGILLAQSDAPAVMGIINVTPDSFSDGGACAGPEAAAERALELVNQGAAIIDIGGESSRPGARPVSLDEELARVIPAVNAVRSRVSIPISIDTAKPEVARQAVLAGASIINSIKGAAHDPEIDALAAREGVGIVIMHMKGEPATMQDDPTYIDVFREVYDALAARVDRLIAAGIDPESIAIDPGIGFGKTMEHNLTLLHRLGELRALGKAIVVGTSRKRLLGKLTGGDPRSLLDATIASNLWAISQGALAVRVHDVQNMANALKVWRACENPAV